MIKLYLVVIDSKYDREKVLSFLDKHPTEITFWFFSLPYSFFLKSELSPKQIFDLIQTEFGENKLFVTEVTSNHYGRLPKDHWEHFK